uniref:Ciliary neurotrophic factor n=1 Tax=Cyclopterus lumpus TaxID=8103 RepID=A0A8C3AJI3_CYCLU
MAAGGTRQWTGSDLYRSTVARATSIAKTLLSESSDLLDLYRKRESFTADVAEGRLVSVGPAAPQLGAKATLLRLHSALLQCHDLLENAITREEEELGGGKKGAYETRRKMVRDRLSFLLNVIGELLKAAGGSVATRSEKAPESSGSTGLFELKLRLYRTYKEVDYWAKAAITTLHALPPVITKERATQSLLVGALGVLERFRVHLKH